MTNEREAQKRIDAAALAWACDEVKREADIVACGGSLASSHEARLAEAIAVLRLAVARYEPKP